MSKLYFVQQGLGYFDPSKRGIGLDLEIAEDLAPFLGQGWDAFKREIHDNRMEKKNSGKVGSFLNCRALWMLSEEMNIGDLVLSPVNASSFRLGRVSGHYSYCPENRMRHRRPVQWSESLVPRSGLSGELKNSIDAHVVVADITRHIAEVAPYAQNIRISPVQPFVSGPTIISSTSFALEDHLESFLASNWEGLQFSRNYSIYEKDGRLVGRQYPTKTGPVDILAISKDKKRFLVIELKRDRTSDVVVGQLSRYMGCIREELAQPDQIVEGAIVAFDDDYNLRMAVAAHPGITFYRYHISFTMKTGN